MSDKITITLDDKTKAGFDSLKKNIEATAKSASEADKRIEGLNQELQSRAAKKFAEDMQALADEADGTAAAIQDLANKFGITTSEAKALRKELESRDIAKAATEAKDLADEMDHLAFMTRRETEAQKELRKELRTRELNEVRQAAKQLADEMDGSLGKRKALESQKAWGTTLLSIKAGYDLAKEGAQRLREAITTLADRGVPAFERLNTTGRKFVELLFELGEDHNVQRFADSFTQATENFVIPAVKKTASALSYFYDDITTDIQDVLIGLSVLAENFGITSREYTDALYEEAEAQEKHQKKLSNLEAQGAAERKRIRAQEKKDRDELLSDPGKKMRADDAFREGLQDSSSDELSSRIAKQKAKMEKEKQRFRANDPEKDLSQNVAYVKMSTELAAMESRMLELEKQGGLAEVARGRVESADDQVTMRKRQLDMEHRDYAGDSALDDAKAKRAAAEKDLLDNLQGKQKQKEWERQQVRDAKEAEIAEKQVQRRKKQLDFQNQEMDSDEQLNKLIEHRNTLEKDLNKSLEERKKIEDQLRVNRERRGDKREEVFGIADDKDAIWRAQVNRNNSENKEIQEQKRRLGQAARDAEAKQLARPVAQNVTNNVTQTASSTVTNNQNNNVMMPPGSIPQQPFFPATPPAETEPAPRQLSPLEERRKALAERRQSVIDSANQEFDARESQMTRKGWDGDFSPGQQASNARARKALTQRRLAEDRQQRASEVRRQKTAEAKARGLEMQRRRAEMATRPASAEKKWRNKFGIYNQQTEDDNQSREAQRRFRDGDATEGEIVASLNKKRDALEKEKEGLKNNPLGANAGGVKATEAEIEKLEREIKWLKKRADDIEEAQRHPQKGDPNDLPDELDHGREVEPDWARQRGDPNAPDAPAFQGWGPDHPGLKPAGRNPVRPEGQDAANAIKQAADAAGGAGGFSQTVTEGMKFLGEQVSQLHELHRSLSDQINQAMQQTAEARDRALSNANRSRMAGGMK